MKALQITAVAALGLCALCASAETDISGYSKNLAVISDAGDLYASGSDEVFLDDYQRLRLKARYEAYEWLRLDMDYELVLAWGDTIGAMTELREGGIASAEAAFLALSLQPRPRFMDLESELSSGSRYNLYHQLDRLKLRMVTESVDFSIGRQSVTWGSGMLWSPTDLFAAFSPTEIDRDEKLGVDVVRLAVWLSSESSLDLVYEPLDFDETGSADPDDSSALGRYTTHVGEYDVAFCGGYVAGDWVAGGDFTGYIGDGGIHGELLFVDVNDSGEKDYARAVVGYDYSFQALYQPYMAVEYFYNGFGSSYPAGYLEVLAQASVQRSFARGTSYNVGTHYLGGMLALTITPLIAVQNRLIVNLEDTSANEYLSMSYSMSDNTELILGGGINMGDSASEFGGWTKQALLYFKGYF